MPVRPLLVALVGRLFDLQQLQPSARPRNQKTWLAEKFEEYKEHHRKKTLKLFFPTVYKDYFTLWPPTPTEEELAAAKGDAKVATARVQKKEQRVRDRYPHG